MENRSLIVITRGLRIVVPPELYLSPALARSEANRWVAMIGAVAVGDVSRTPKSPLAADAQQQTVVNILSVSEADISVAASPDAIWIGVQSTRTSFARVSVRAVFTDALHAAEWFRRRAPKKAVIAADPEFRWEALIDRKGAETYVGAHRLKHVGESNAPRSPI